MSKEREIVVLFSSQSLYDVEDTLEVLLSTLRGPKEPAKPKPDKFGMPPEYIQARENLIRSSPSFWENLMARHTTLDIYGFISRLGCKPRIITTGRHFNSGRPGFYWIQDHFLGSDILHTETPRAVKGDVLVDIDIPRIAEWCISNPQGLAIIPQAPENKYYNIQGVEGYVRYNGTNSKEYKKAIVEKLGLNKK